MRDTYNIIPVTLAVLLHALIFGSLFVALDWTKKPQPLVPLAISATLITETGAVWNDQLYGAGAVWSSR